MFSYERARESAPWRGGTNSSHGCQKVSQKSNFISDRGTKWPAGLIVGAGLVSAQIRAGIPRVRGTPTGMATSWHDCDVFENFETVSSTRGQRHVHRHGSTTLKGSTNTMVLKCRWWTPSGSEDKGFVVSLPWACIPRPAGLLLRSPLRGRRNLSHAVTE